MKKLLVVLAVFSIIAKADLIELNDTQEFKALINESTVPVVVQFSAYWCGPCQNLKGVLHKVAPSYNDSQVKIAYVDAYVNSALQTYLQGGYPTVRTFKSGKLMSPAFVGSKSESSVRSFIDGLINEGEVEGGFCPIQ